MASNTDRQYQCKDVHLAADLMGDRWRYKQSFTPDEIRELLPGITDRNIALLDHDNDGRYCERRVPV